MIVHFEEYKPMSKKELEQFKNILTSMNLQKISEGVEIHPRRANNIEFDFTSWSWHGIENDHYSVWNKRFGENLVYLTLVNLREWLKKRPNYGNIIEEYYSGNWAFFIWDSLERAEKWNKEKGDKDEEQNRITKDINSGF